MQIPLCRQTALSIALGFFVGAAGALQGCTVDNAGLGGENELAQGSTAGNGVGMGGGGPLAGATGTPGTGGGTTGAGAEGGNTGTAGHGGSTGASSGVAGGAGTGAIAGSQGMAGAATTGTAGTGAAGTTGTGTAGSGAAGVGAAGVGAAGAGAAGGGMGGTGGPGGAAGRGGACGPTTCNGCCQGNQCVTTPDAQSCGGGGNVCRACEACFICGLTNTCEPDPKAKWTVVCQSASIKMTKPNGSTWDQSFSQGPGSGPGSPGPSSGSQSANPDPFCELTTSDGRARSSPVITDSLDPVWNANVTPNGGGGLTAAVLMATGGWRISVYDQDGTGAMGGSSDELICAVAPAVTAVTMQNGVLTMTNVDSCNQLTLSLSCAQ